MNFQMSLHTEEVLTFTDVVPEKLKKRLVFPTVFYSSGYWGYLLLQVFEQQGFTAFDIGLCVRERIAIHTVATFNSISLPIAYKNNFSFSLSLDKLSLRENEFNLVCLSPGNGLTAVLQKGNYKCFGISYSKTYLKRFVPYLDGLADFLNKEVSSLFSPVNRFATKPMLTVIEDVMKHTYNSDLAEIYLESKALELLSLAFEKLDYVGVNGMVMGAMEIDRANAIKFWIDQHPEEAGSLKEIAAKFAFNEFKLKKEFKEVVGLPIFEYILQTKLEKAKNKLLETELPISDIGYDAGYSAPAHFTRAFKNKFGVTPRYLRTHSKKSAKPIS